VRAHLVQLDIAWEDKPANHERIRALLAPCLIEPGDIIALPEMFDTGFSIRVERTTTDPERSVEFLRAIASAHRATVIASIPVMEDGGRARNRAHIVDAAGEIAATYDKVHPFSYGLESQRFSGGDEACTVRIAMGATSRPTIICPVVCYDLRFPELFRLGLDRGAEVFVVVANWPRERAEHWRALLIARAIENQAIVLGVNRAGTDPNLSYAGGSIAIDPRGRILGEAGPGEGVLSVVIDPEWVRTWRDKFPSWRDRRVEMGPIRPETRQNEADAKNPILVAPRG
jgi:predicted amidohydrolase